MLGREINCGVRDGEAIAGEGGLRADLLAGMNRILAKPRQKRSRRAGFHRHLDCAPHLTEHLWLAKDHGIETGSYREEVRDRVAVGECIRSAREIIRLNLCRFGDPRSKCCLPSLAFWRNRVKLGAVAR